MRTKLLSLKTLLVICLMAIVGGVETWAQTTEKVDFSAQGYSDGASVTSYKGKDFSIAFVGAKYYDTGSAVRIYNGNKMTISSSTKIISKVVFTYSGDKKPSIDTGYKLSSGSYSAKSNTWTADAKNQTQSVTFTNTNSSQYRIQAIEVTFASTSSVAAPTFSEDSKSFSDKFRLALSRGSDANMIMYTTDGSTPSYKNKVGVVYSDPISITHSTTVKAIAVSSKDEESDVVTKEYKLELPAPIISEATNKVFTAPFTVSLSTEATAAEAILYTLDGTVPSWENKATEIYTEPIQISATTTLKAVSYATNGTTYEYSPIATATYTEQGDAPIVIWSEDWSGFKANYQPTKGENATYVCSGSSKKGTRIFTEKLAGGESPEILVASKGFLTITINDLKGASEGLILTFKANQTKGQFAASVDNAVIISADAEGSNKLYVHKYIMALNEGATSLTITLKNDLTSNARVDDLELSTYSGVGSFKITEAGYGTYYSSKAYTMPEGVKGYIITGNEGTSLVMNEAYAAGDVVPAKTALVVEGAANKYYTLVAESTELTPADNKLHGSDEAETTYVDGTDVKYYKLSYNNEGNNLGFYWGSENGAAFTNGAHKAYLALDSETLLSQSRGFSLADLAHGVTTGINTTVKSATQSNFIYDLNGRRINSLNGAAKGVYIMNGQKVLVK